MDETVTLKDKILFENQAAHDYYADQHDSVCSYISKKNCHEFYGSLLATLSFWSEREKDKSRVLELGCGTGTWVDIFDGAQEFVGVDISALMIKEACKKNGDPTKKFYCNDVVSFLKQEIQNGSKYDVIVSSSFLHHLYDIDHVVALITEVLNPSGIYVAIHEPIKPVIKEAYPHPLGKKIDEKIAFLFGYDCDLQQNPFFSRLARTAKDLIPFKGFIKRVLGKKNETNCVEEVSFVDYKLSDGQIFHPLIFANKIYPSIAISFDSYSYYAFPFLGRFFGKLSNYFCVTFTKAPS